MFTLEFYYIILKPTKKAIVVDIAYIRIIRIRCTLITLTKVTIFPGKRKKERNLFDFDVKKFTIKVYATEKEVASGCEENIV